MDVEKLDHNFIVCSMDLISGMMDSLGAQVGDLISQSKILELAFVAAKDELANIRQCAHAFFGQCANFAYSQIRLVPPWPAWPSTPSGCAAPFLPCLSLSQSILLLVWCDRENVFSILEVLLADMFPYSLSISACNNAVWALGCIVQKLGSFLDLAQPLWWSPVPWWILSPVLLILTRKITLAVCCFDCSVSVYRRR